MSNPRSFPADWALGGLAAPEGSKLQVRIDLDPGMLTATAAGSCDFNGNGCRDARSWELIAPNDEPEREIDTLSVIRDSDGLRVQIRALNALRSDKPLLSIPTIDAVCRLDHRDGRLSWRTKGDPYPSEQFSWIPSGRSTAGKD